MTAYQPRAISKSKQAYLQPETQNL